MQVLQIAAEPEFDLIGPRCVVLRGVVCVFAPSAVRFVSHSFVWLGFGRWLAPTPAELGSAPAAAVALLQGALGVAQATDTSTPAYVLSLV